MSFVLRRLLSPAVFVAAGFVATGCATRAVQTEALLSSQNQVASSSPTTSLPRHYEVQDVPFTEQSEGFCGPATLAMAMQWSRQNETSVNVNDLAREVYTPEKKGTLPLDLVGATRRRGLMGVQLSGLRPLLDEISSGHPVIVFENLALTWFPRWHFALAYGYDLDRETITLHSGKEKAKHWSLYKFERSWMLGEYWGLVVLPPGQIAVAAGELANTTAAVGLEQAGKNDEAEKSYRAILEKWPTSLGALIGLGNVTFQKKDFRESVRVLSAAAEVHPNLAVVWHNLATAQGALAKSETKRKAAATLEAARTSAKRAIEPAILIPSLKKRSGPRTKVGRHAELNSGEDRRFHEVDGRLRTHRRKLRLSSGRFAG